jgi:hypothetical protein
MSQHILNCFEITNAAELEAKYRLVDVEGPFDPAMGDGELGEANVQQLLKRIAFEERIAVALCRGGRQPVLAIPAAHRLRRNEYGLSPDVASLRPRDEEQRLCLGNLDNETRRIGLAFLGYHLRSPLRGDGRLWSDGPSTYLRRKPINYKNDDREVDVYGGFGLHLGLAHGKLVLWIKLTHRYVESSWLPDAYDEHQIRELLKMRHALYHYGNKWFRVQLLGVTGKSIDQQRFIPDGTDESISIYDYTLREVGGNKAPPWIESLSPTAGAITYQYPGNQKKRYGAASLCKLLLATEDPRVSAVHRFSVKSPDVRFEEHRAIVETFLQNASFQGESVRIGHSATCVRRRVFPVPAQEFGQGQVLRVGHDAGAGEIRVKDIGRKRMELLLDPNGGVAVTSPLDAQYLIVPESQERRIAEDFQSRLERTTRGLLQRPFVLKRVLYSDRNVRTLKQQIEAILGAIDSAGVVGRGVLMLPPTCEKDLHNFLKRKLKDRFQFQCVAAARVAEFYRMKPENGTATYVVQDDMTGRYVSYLRYTAMGLLIVNRQWPWVLAHEMHYDRYIGLDVLHNTGAFTFFAQGGRECYLFACQSQQKEKLLRTQVRTVIYDNLKTQLQDAKEPTRSVILRRDGRSFASERLGFRDAIERLIADGLLPNDVLFGVIEVHKTSAEGMRLVEALDDQTLRNPTVGAWEIIDDSCGIVCTTGFPFSFRGTVNPLTLRTVEGELNLQWVLEDTFWMSQLAWAVPDRCMRLSVDLKLCDDYLRAIAASADEDEGQYGEDEAWPQQEERIAIGWGG